jgi:carboxylate-amine ligase
MATSSPLHLFEAFGVELEYIIVDRDNLSAKPIADEVLRAIDGVERGGLEWSNDLVLHLIDLRTNGLTESLDSLGALFQKDVAEIQRMLDSHGARVMPTSVHPWMDPATETVPWPHENPVYEAFERVFSCRTHGWSNAPCARLSLPFDGDDEFGRLHAAIRMVLPIIPAIASSSPVLDGKPTGYHDGRLNVYRNRARTIPMVAGLVIPEPAYTRDRYEAKILDPLYEAIAPHDPDGILQYEWLNARGAVARFDRGTIEIGTIDMQECPVADIAVAHAITSVIRALVDERWQDFAEQSKWETDRLNRILLDTTKRAEHAVITDTDYLEALGWGDFSCSAGELWRHLVEDVVYADVDYDGVWAEAIDVIVSEGTLAERILRATGPAPARERLEEVYRELCSCLDEGTMFHAGG